MKKYAIIRTGSKQYKVQEGDVIEVELLPGETIEFKEVLYFHDGKIARVGKPVVDGSVVKGTILKEIKGPKVIAFKFKRRQGYQRKVGHRQRYSQVRVEAIEG